MGNSIKLGNSDTGEVQISYEGKVESLHLYGFLQNFNSSKDKISAFEKALLIGGHALNLDTTSVLISEIEKNLEGRLSTIRQIFENRKSMLNQPAAGKIAESTFDSVLKEFSSEMKYGDIITLTGDNSQDGKVRGVGDRKLGDIQIQISGSDLKITVESKYTEAGPSMGDLVSRGTYKKLSVDTHARGQVRGAQANRESHYAIFITKPGSSVAKSMGSNLVLDHGDMAIYVVANLETGEFEDLKVAYMVARALTLSLEWPIVQQAHLRSVAALLFKSTNKLAKYQSRLDDLKGFGKKVMEVAGELISDYEDDKKAIDMALGYLEAVMIASNAEALKLKVMEIELLTGLSLEIKKQEE